MAAVVIFAVVSPAVALQRNKRAAQREAHDLARGKPVRAWDQLVKSFGRRSSGSVPQRGSGTLLCTDDELIFVQWSPRTRLVIPRERIVAVQAPTAHNGREAGAPLLCVVYEDTSGEEEAMAWLVRDRRAWAMALSGRAAAGAPASPS